MYIAIIDTHRQINYKEKHKTNIITNHNMNLMV